MQTLPFVEQGQPDSPSVLLLHGYTDSCHSFDLMLPHLPPVVRAVAPTLRGHGDAAKPERGYTPSHFAADAIALLDACGIQRTIAIGHSMGSRVALALALEHPSRVAGLVLIGGFATLAQNPAAGELMEYVRNLTGPPDAAFVEAFQRSTVARAVPDAFLATMIAESLKVPAFVWREALTALVESDVRPLLHRIAVPTLLLWGDKDTIVTRADQEELAAYIGNARIEVFAGTGHAPHWEEPGRVADQIARFVMQEFAALPG